MVILVSATMDHLDPTALVWIQLHIVFLYIKNVTSLTHFKLPLMAIEKHIRVFSLGNMLGHELMHAFDANSIGEGPHPEKEWLDNNVLMKFDKRANCLVRQYSTHCFQNQGECLSGEKTLSEKI